MNVGEGVRGFGLGVAVRFGSAEGVGVRVSVVVAVRVRVRLGVKVGVAVRVGVRVGVNVFVGEPVGVAGEVVKFTVGVRLGRVGITNAGLVHPVAVVTARLAVASNVEVGEAVTFVMTGLISQYCNNRSPKRNAPAARKIRIKIRSAARVRLECRRVLTGEEEPRKLDGNAPVSFRR